MLPYAACGRVAGLKRCDRLTGFARELGIGLETGLGCPVIRLDGFEHVGVRRRRGQRMLAIPTNEHAELRAPVPDVVLSDHVVSEKAEHTGEHVADDRPAQVSDVHLLGDVRLRILDDHAERPVHRRQADAVRLSVGTWERGNVGADLGRWNARQVCGQEFRFESNVKEPRAGDLERLGEVSNLRGDRGFDPFRHVARLAAERPGQRQGRVALVIAELRVTRGPHARVRRRGGVCDRGNGRGEVLAQTLLQAHELHGALRTARGEVNTLSQPPRGRMTLGFRDEHPRRPAASRQLTQAPRLRAPRRRHGGLGGRTCS